MKQRIITGLVAGMGFLYLVWLGGIPFSLLIALLALIGYFEFLRMNKTRFYSTEGIIGLITVVLIIFTQNPIFSFFNLLDVTSVILGAIIIYLMLTVIKKNRVTFEQIGYYLLGALYIGFGFSYLLFTRLNDNGLSLTLLILIATFASDSGAYFTGMYFGKNKLWPEISPKKTIEGAFGGIVFAIVAGLIINYFFAITENLLSIIWASILISIIGQVGDLVESALKRAKNVKDSGALLPGHGGVLDRFDSLIFIFPIIHLLHIL